MLAIVESVVVIMSRGVAERMSDLGKTTCQDNRTIEEGDSAGVVLRCLLTQERMTELQRFNLAVEIIKHFEGWHTVRNYPYVGWGHQLQPGERYSARTMTMAQGDRLLRQDLMKFYKMFDGYGKDQMLLAVLAYNVGPYAILGTSKRPRSTLLKKLDAGNRNIFNDYMRFCRYKGRKVKSAIE